MERLIEHVDYCPNGEDHTEDSPYDVEFVQTPLHREIVARIEEVPPNYAEIAEWIKFRYGRGFRINPYVNNSRCLKLFSEAHIQSMLESIPGVMPFLPGSGRIATPNYAIIREKDREVSFIQRGTFDRYISVDALVVVDGVTTVVEIKMSNIVSKAGISWGNHRGGRTGAIRPAAVERILKPLSEYAKKTPHAVQLGMIAVYPQPEMDWELLRSFKKAGGLVATIPEDRDIFEERSRIAAHYLINGKTEDYYQAERTWRRRNNRRN